MKFIRSEAYIPIALLLIFSLCSSCKQESSQAVQDQNQSLPPVEIDTIALLAKSDHLFQLGQTALTTGNKDSAIYYHEQALVLRERTGKSGKELFSSYVKVGRLYLSAHKYDVANKYFEKAQAIARNHSIPIDELIAFLLDLSYIKTNLQDIPTAISLLNKLISLAQTNHLDRLTSGNIYFALGNAYLSDTQLELSIQTYKKALDYFNEIHDYQKSGMALTSLGMVYNRMNENEKALISFRQAIRNYLRSTDPESNQLAKVYLQKAVTHQNVGEYDSAQYYHQWNLKIRRALYGEKDATTFGAKFSLGQFYEFIHHYDSAAKYSHEGLISLVRNFNDHSLTANPIPESTELNVDLVDGLVGKATALKRLSERDSGKDYFDLALNTYLLADSVFSVFRRNLKYDDPQLRELEVGHIPYNQMLELTFYLFRKTGDEHYITKSIDIMEQSRAVLLENALNRAQQYDAFGSAHTFRKDETDLFTQRSEILRQLSSPDVSKQAIDSLNDALLVINNSFGELQESIERTNPGYFNLRYNQKGVSLKEIQLLLKERNSMLVEYQWSEEKIYVLMIRPNKIETKVIVQTDSFKKSFTNFITQLQIAPVEVIKSENFLHFSQSAFDLHKALMGDLLPKDIDRNRKINLIISANGPLATFPFEALITRLPESIDVNYRLPYLFQSFPISYAYSPGILVRQSKSARDGSKLLALGFAGSGSVDMQRDGFSNLPGTEKEINSIKGVMKNSANRYYLEADASEAVFKNKVADFDIIHLAIHGIADSTNALRSKLVFRPEEDTVEDSNLYAHELYNLNLDNLDLAVLSACESGIGKQQAGEGMMSIARGFAYAGCPTLVISLWKIDDRTSAQVMGDFYKHISHGEGIDLALANAKSDYLLRASEFNSHPAYWAAFLQVGDTRAIDVKGFNWRLTLLLLAALLSIFIGVAVWRKTYVKKG